MPIRAKALPRKESKELKQVHVTGKFISEFLKSQRMDVLFDMTNRVFRRRGAGGGGADQDCRGRAPS